MQFDSQRSAPRAAAANEGDLNYSPTSPPVVMSHNVSGPVDPHEFYMEFGSPSPSEMGDGSDMGRSPPPLPSAGLTQHDAANVASASRSMSRSPLQTKLRMASSTARNGERPLSSVRSNPSLPSPRQEGNVKDMAHRFDHTTTADETSSITKPNNSRNRYKRPTDGSRGHSSPVRNTSGEDRTSPAKLYKRRPVRPKSPTSTSFETNNSFSSNATAKSSASQPQAGSETMLPPKSENYPRSRPLFGEITPDGRWNGNFDLDDLAPPDPPFARTMRRGSEDNILLGHRRSRSYQDPPQSPLLSSGERKLNHKRSRTDIENMAQPRGPTLPKLDIRGTSVLFPPSSETTPITSHLNGSRIPVASRRPSHDFNAATSPYPRSSSALSNPPSYRRRSKSPSRTRAALETENAQPISNNPRRHRYDPSPQSPSQTNQTLAAKIVAPLPKTSPPLRSSRPRQPVNSATTSASRARAAEAQRLQNSNQKDGRRPSEQWLGKPYEAQNQPRSRKKFPELGNIDFEERRARIQRAISQNLDASKSQESLNNKSRSGSRNASRSQSRIGFHGNDSQLVVGTETGVQKDDGQHPTGEMNSATEKLASHNLPSRGIRPTGSTVTTAGLPDRVQRASDPSTAHTEFEDDSPVLGRAAAPLPVAPEPMSQQPPTLSSASYQPPSSKKSAPPLPPPTDPFADSSRPGSRRGHALGNADHMRELHSESAVDRSGTGHADKNLTVDSSPSDLGDRWGLDNLLGDQGSIRIMLDNDTSSSHHVRQPSDEPNLEHVQSSTDVAERGSRDRSQEPRAAASNGRLESPFRNPQAQSASAIQDFGHRKLRSRDENPTTTHSRDAPGSDGRTDDTADGVVGRVLNHFRMTGTVTEEMLQEMQNHMVDLHRISANGGSNALMVQNLLECILDGEHEQSQTPNPAFLEPWNYDMPLVTPDTPKGEDFEPGTVVVYGSDTPENIPEEDENFETKIRRADDEWSARQRGEDHFVAGPGENPPPPPPKDAGYTPRSSTGPDMATIPSPNLMDGLRISGFGPLDIADIHAAGERAEDGTVNPNPVSPMSEIYASSIPAPSHPPPEPPKLPAAVSDVRLSQYSDRESSEPSPRFRRNVQVASGSSRPSTDSQRPQPSVPPSLSMTSFTESTRQDSMDSRGDGPANLAKTDSPSPEQKRLFKRRHIVRELLDTENSYHQDLKIVEDIYKATCTAELVSPEDKKILFGNCDEIERFALHFYDEMRKAASQVYVPAKSQRWGNKRNSYSTTQSDGPTQTGSVDTVNDEKDRTTTIGRTFLTNLPRMEQVYGTYLKNHDAANQRLSALQSTSTVKCWLAECHANASDITSAWDLDSLLVKPTQRVAKYPMLLQQLLETTSEDHPDHENLKAAGKEIVSMLIRINDAKKRADLVDQIVNRKRKDSDVRSGLAKAFGRRTEKIKERVGIAEAFQDPAFDELAHKFGGHFIRLQICMRDVQDYVNRTDKAVELINNYAAALEMFADVSPSSLLEIESKWRRYGQVIRELTLVAFGEHKSDVQKRVLSPMIQCIKLHEGPQNAMNKRKKRIVDYAKCKSDERRGQKPDKKTVEASDMYIALNDQLKIDLPRLYSLTGTLVQGCLKCFLDIQIQWHDTWQRKLRPLLEAADVPGSIQEIEPAFTPDYKEIEKKLQELSICNGTLKRDAASYASLSSTLVDHSEHTSSKRRTSTLNSEDRALSVSSERSANPTPRRHSGIYNPAMVPKSPPLHGRIRSNSSMSTRRTPTQTPTAPHGRPYSNTNASSTSFTNQNRLSASNQQQQQQQQEHQQRSTGRSSGVYSPRPSAEYHHSLRPSSGATYFTARPDHSDTNTRFSGIFSSAMPPDNGSSSSDAHPHQHHHHQQAASPKRGFPNIPVLFVCASLFEFSIDKTRREGGYPYLTYVQGEVFDVIAQKGELWLAKNQDDSDNELGWIWEQHFVILSQE